MTLRENVLQNLEIIANIASIITAFAGATGFAIFMCRNTLKRKKLENHLRNALAHPGYPNDPGTRTVWQLVGQLGMTEQDILKAAFSSKLIHREPIIFDGIATLKLSRVEKYSNLKS